jgi:hypothetical protein
MDSNTLLIPQEEMSKLFNSFLLNLQRQQQSSNINGPLTYPPIQQACSSIKTTCETDLSINKMKENALKPIGIRKKHKNISTHIDRKMSILLRNIFNTSYELHKWYCYKKIIHIIIPTDVKMLFNKYGKQQNNNFNFEQQLQEHILNRENFLNAKILQLREIFNKNKNNTTLDISNKLISTAASASNGIRNRIWTKTYNFIINLAIKNAYEKLTKLENANDFLAYIQLFYEHKTVIKQLFDLQTHYSNCTIPKFIQLYEFCMPKQMILNKDNTNSLVTALNKNIQHLILNEYINILDKYKSNIEIEIDKNPIAKFFKQDTTKTEAVELTNLIINLKGHRKTFSENNSQYPLHFMDFIKKTNEGNSLDLLKIFYNFFANSANSNNIQFIDYKTIQIEIIKMINIDSTAVLSAPLTQPVSSIGFLPDNISEENKENIPPIKLQKEGQLPAFNTVSPIKERKDSSQGVSNDDDCIFLADLPGTFNLKTANCNNSLLTESNKRSNSNDDLACEDRKNQKLNH